MTRRPMTRRDLPALLIAFRALAGPAGLALAYVFGPAAGGACAAILAAGLVSDIFDGVIARRLGCATPALRTADGRADLLFWICTGAAALVMRPATGAWLLPMAAALLVLEFVAPIVSLVRFRREASTHHRLSKLFGLGLWALFTTVLLSGRPHGLQLAVFALGLLSQAEAIAIMLVLPEWRVDVGSVFAALILRRQAARPRGAG